MCHPDRLTGAGSEILQATGVIERSSHTVKVTCWSPVE